MPVRDPHEPVIPGNENHAKREASHRSMPIGSQGPLRDPHEPVLPEGTKAGDVIMLQSTPHIQISAGELRGELGTVLAFDAVNLPESEEGGEESEGPRPKQDA